MFCSSFGKYPSQLKHIHSAPLTHYSRVKQFCLDVILKPMIEDPRHLSTESLIAIVYGKEHLIYSALATFSADNLSAHMIDGFQIRSYFDVTKSMPPDIKHNMLEGVLLLTMKQPFVKHMNNCCDNRAE